MGAVGDGPVGAGATSGGYDAGGAAADASFGVGAPADTRRSADEAGATPSDNSVVVMSVSPEIGRPM